jgi:hypothetical protein
MVRQIPQQQFAPGHKPKVLVEPFAVRNHGFTGDNQGICDGGRRLAGNNSCADLSLAPTRLPERIAQICLKSDDRAKAVGEVLAIIANYEMLADDCG